MRNKIIALITIVTVMLTMGLTTTGALAAKKKAKTVPLKKIEMKTRSVTMNVGDSKKLKVRITPKKAVKVKKLRWTTSDKKIVTVKKGKIKALRPGKAVVKASYGKRSAKCTVIVKSPLKGISLSKKNATMERDGSRKLNVIYRPSNTTDNKKAAWTSSNTSVATVRDGQVYARSGGSATITATVGKCKATCKVTVRVPLRSISLNKTNTTIIAGEYDYLTVSYYPANTTDDKTVTWSSSNTSVATISGGRIYARSGGTATITAKVGSCTAKCTVTVRVPLKSISVSYSTLKMENGTGKNLYVSYNPSNTTDDKTVTWSSSNTSVVTVSGGTVTAKKGGTATITAKCGTKTSRCTVLVKLASKISASATVSGQTITVKGTGHAYPDSKSYAAELYNNSSCKNYLAYHSSVGAMKFAGLNPGQVYYVKVYERKPVGYDEYQDTARVIKVKTGKSGYPVYTKKASAVNAIVNKAKARKGSVTFYFPGSQSEEYFESGNKLIDAFNGGIARIYVDKESKNEYDERVKVNEKAYYKYTVGIWPEYSKAKQTKYLNKINSVKRTLTGSAKSKVIKANTYFKNKCKYDYSFKRYTGYDALVTGKSVCDGYAHAASIVLNMAGVKCERVTGRGNGTYGWDGHAWNIVKVGSKWYSCDFCWNSCLKNNKYLLKGTGNKTFWSTHKLDAQFKTAKWKKAYPMAKGNL